MVTPELRLVPVSSLLESSFQTRDFEEDESFTQLVRSIRQHGLVEPIVAREIMGSLEVVAGHRRLRAARKAGLETVPVVVRVNLSEEDTLVIQLAENLQRSDYSEDEKRRALGKFAGLTGLDAKRIAERLDMSYSWVLTYLPDEFKDKTHSEVAKLGGEARARLLEEGNRESEDVGTSLVPKSQDIVYEENPSLVDGESLSAAEPISETLMKDALVATETVECHNCHMGKPRNTMKTVSRELYCASCAPFVHVARRNESKPSPPFKDSWEHRKQAMSPGVSKMDEAMLVKLQSSSEIRELGWSIEFQKVYYVVVCVSDVSLTKDGKEVLCFWDGSDVHKNPERDEENRERAKQEQQQHGIPTEIVAEPYKAYSDKERDRLFGVVLERLRELEKWGEPKAKKEVD